MEIFFHEEVISNCPIYIKYTPTYRQPQPNKSYDYWKFIKYKPSVHLLIDYYDSGKVISWVCMVNNDSDISTLQLNEKPMNCTIVHHYF